LWLGGSVLVDHLFSKTEERLPAGLPYKIILYDEYNSQHLGLVLELVHKLIGRLDKDASFPGGRFLDLDDGVFGGKINAHVGRREHLDGLFLGL